MPFNHETGRFIKSGGETSNASERRLENNFFEKIIDRFFIGKLTRGWI